MISRRVFLKWTLFLAMLPSLALAQQTTTAPPRDLRAIQILREVMRAAGDSQSVAAIRDIVETGEVKLEGGGGITGNVKILALDGHLFRMDMDLPRGRRTWIVKDGLGSKKEEGVSVPFSDLEAAYLDHFTFPLEYATAALSDQATDVSLVSTEKYGGKSVYRLRLKDPVGMDQNAKHGIPLTRDLLVNSVTFNIVCVEDHPVPAGLRRGKGLEPGLRQIEFSDFRGVSGVQVPFSIDIKLLGIEALSVRLTDVDLNAKLGDSDFSD